MTGRRVASPSAISTHRAGPLGITPGNAAWTWASTAALLSFVAGRCLVPMDETDLFYNLRLGEIVLGTHTVPRTNLLSFTYPDHPDPNLAWIFQVLLALAHRGVGIPGTVLLKTVFVVATFALLFRVAIRRGAHPALAAAALALAAWAAEPRFVERPHLVTFVGLGTLLLAVERAERGAPRLLWALIPIGLVWANGNSCLFLAPAILLLYACGALVDLPGPVSRTTARRAAAVALALGPLLFATPSGAGWMGYVANHFRMPSLRPLQEYRAAEWPTDGPFIFLLLAVALVTVLPSGRSGSATAAATQAAREPRGAHPPPAGFMRQLLPILALAILGSRRIRFVAEFALLSGPFVAARATQLLARLRAPHPRAVGAGAAATVLALASLTVVPRIGAARPFDLGVEPGLVPWAAIRWVDSHGLRRERMYNDLEVGSYLTWNGWPEAPVFQDPRINGYPAELHALLRRPDLRRDEWESLLRRFETSSALITFPDVNPRAALFEPGRWALVYRATDALVFVRRDERRAALIQAAELPLTFRFTPTAGVEVMPLERPPSGSPVRSCEWQRRLADWFIARGDSSQATAALDAALAGEVDCLPMRVREAAREQAASLALDAGQPGRAVALLAGLDSATAATNRGFALLQLGQSAEALREFAEGLRATPDSPEGHFGRAVALARLARSAEATVALRDFLGRWPGHFAAPEARRLLAATAR